MVKFDCVEDLHYNILSLIKVLLLLWLSLLEIKVDWFIWGYDSNWVKIGHGNLICRVKGNGLCNIHVVVVVMLLNRHLLLDILKHILLLSLVVSILQMIGLHINLLVWIIHQWGITVLMNKLWLLHHLIMHRDLLRYVTRIGFGNGLVVEVFLRISVWLLKVLEGSIHLLILIICILLILLEVIIYNLLLLIMLVKIVVILSIMLVRNIVGLSVRFPIRVVVAIVIILGWILFGYLRGCSKTRNILVLIVWAYLLA